MVKIYEVRDTSDDESYYPKAYYSTFDRAKLEVLKIGSDISDFYSDNDNATASIIEHILDQWEGNDGIEVLRIEYFEKYNEETNEYFTLTNIVNDIAKEI